MENITHHLQTALRGKAPVIALPVEGQAPFCLDRKRLAAWSKGVIITRVTMLENRWMKIEGRAGAVRTSCTVHAIDRRTAVNQIGAWAEREREKNLKVIAQGAIGAAAVAAAVKSAAKATREAAKAAKLAALETGGTPELDAAKSEVASIHAAARRHGRGWVKPEPMGWEKPDPRKDEATVIRHVSHHNVPRKVRKSCAVVQWRLKALRTAWYAVTKYNPSRRKSTKNTFLKVKKAAEVMRIVRDAAILRARLAILAPAVLPDPQWVGYSDSFHIDPLTRPKAEKSYRYDPDAHYDRTGLAVRLRIARETIRVLTPPPDDAAEVLEMPAVHELAKAA